jgi:hypothetical protein
MSINIDEESIRNRFVEASAYLDERDRRILAAIEARSAGMGGVVAVSHATGMARSTIRRGLDDLEATSPLAGSIRRPGGGRRSLVDKEPSLLLALEEIVIPSTIGDPMRPLLWVSKSHDKLAAALVEIGYQVSAATIPTLLEMIGYRRQVNRKSYEGGKHPDRGTQFEYINAKAEEYIVQQQPVISVDAKKKENIGDFKNAGSDYRPQGAPDDVRVHDFIDKELGKAIPYGVYDLAANSGYVTIGIDHDTAQFAVNSIRSWWVSLGRKCYPDAKRLMITADGGGSNGSRVRLWKIEIQKLADELQMEIDVCHYPPGCSKWNKIEHRLFCHITQNWRGKPLISLQSIIELIAATATTKGLTVQSIADTRTYQSGIKVTDAELKALNITGHSFRPEWNYTIAPSIL